MTAPYPFPLTYEMCVAEMAQAIGNDFNSARGVAIASAAFALGMAFNKTVAEVHADIKAKMK